MKRKLRLTPVLLFFLTLTGHAQFIITGTHGALDYLHVFNPDTLVFAADPNNLPYMNFPSDTKTMWIDMNDDQVYDVAITAQYTNGQQWYQRFSAWITPLDNNRIAISGYDSCFSYLTPPTFKYRTAMAKPFTTGETINRNLVWYDSASAIAYRNINADFNDCSRNNFPESDKFVALQILANGDTLYGWIELQAYDYDSLVIRQYACNSVSTGIHHLGTQADFKIFPNPNHGVFTVKINENNPQNGKITIHNILGEMVLQPETFTNHALIDMSRFPAGIYWLSWTTDHGSITRKLIIH